MKYFNVGVAVYIYDETRSIFACVETDDAWKRGT